MTLSVPRIGSGGKIYGPPCITFYNVQSGDTWESIAQKFNADVAVLKRANPGGLTGSIKIPLNSAGGSAVVVTPGAPGATAAPGATSPAPMKITFDPGSTTASRIGLVNPGERIQYLVTAAPGQLLTINLQATPNEMTLAVVDPNGLVLKNPDPTYTWSTTISTA
jgi:hypothetical protein